MKNEPMILLVEDDSDMRYFLSGELGKNYRIEMAENGEEGLRKTAQLFPDLIIADVIMPVMDGITMLDHLKRSDETNHIPVILLTAKVSVASRIEALNCGADQYITKPFRTDILNASISNLLQQRRRLLNSIINGPKHNTLINSNVIPVSRDDAFLQKVIMFVEAGLSDPGLSIGSMADISNISRSAFYRKFKSLTNKAPVEFLRDIRLKKATQLFDCGENVVTEVAYKVGFDNVTYFSTCFKVHFGHSPSEYIKRCSTSSRNTLV